MGEVVIQVEQLGKSYQLAHARERNDTLRDALVLGLRDLGRRLRAGLSGRPAPRLDREEFWALRDVSFQVRRGEVLGIIGRNGAGKSTLLKLLSRITEPATGWIGLRGRVASLLEVGTGFHPELTGRENVYLNGAILGMRRAEIRRKFDEIVAFAEVERFLDTPVKRYSSGMYTRLAFAVAAHLEPEILIVDEVLAVGDVAFQQKCLGKMEEVSRAGRTVLFVSHNMQAVRNLCGRCLLLADGRVIEEGNPGDVVARYYRQASEVAFSPETAVHDAKVRRGSGAARFSKVEVQDPSGGPRTEFRVGDPIRFVLEYEVYQPVPSLFLSVLLRSMRHREVITSAWVPLSRGPVAAGASGRAVVDFPCPALRPGEYPLYCWLGDGEARSNYDDVDSLFHPLMVSTDKGLPELGYDPTIFSGYFDVDYVLREHQLISGPSAAGGPAVGAGAARGASA